MQANAIASANIYRLLRPPTLYHHLHQQFLPQPLLHPRCRAARVYLFNDQLWNLPVEEPEETIPPKNIRSFVISGW